MMQEWFTESKLGIFVHWGVYAVGRRGRESWPIFRSRVAYNHKLDHMRVLTGKSEAELKAMREVETNYAELRDKMAKQPERADDPELQAAWQRFLEFHRTEPVRRRRR